MVKTVAASAALLALAACAHAQQTPAPAATAEPEPATNWMQPDCSDSAYRAFDFWLGEWSAYTTGTENLAGRSTIAVAHNGCVITENWRSMGVGYSGQSSNMYDRYTGRWEQFWTDSRGDITHFVGGPHEGGMRLVAEDDRSPDAEGPIFNRMTFTPNPDGSVRQHGEASQDRGQTWITTYDFTYRPRTPTP